MKIGIISSGRDTLSLFKFLSRYDNEYLVYVDQEYFPYWEKSLNSAIDRIQKAGEFLIKKWAESIIVDPIYELSLKYLWKDINFNVLPLFQQYLIDYGFKYSLVWKIWVLTDFWSLSQVQELLVKEEKWYTPNSEQMNIKKFSYPFHYRVKSTSSWVANVYDMWVRNPFMIRMLKNDLRYFKDAYVDTVLPMNYHYFRVQRTIKAFFNFNKTRFHDFSMIEECFKNLISWNKPWNYWVSIRINQPSIFITRDKQLMRDMQRGRNTVVNIEEI